MQFLLTGEVFAKQLQLNARGFIRWQIGNIRMGGLKPAFFFDNFVISTIKNHDNVALSPISIGHQVGSNKCDLCSNTNKNMD